MQLTDLLTTCLRQGAVPFAYPITSDTRLPIFQHVTLKTWVGPGYEPGWLWISLLECVSISAQDSYQKHCYGECQIRPSGKNLMKRHRTSRQHHVPSFPS